MKGAQKLRDELDHLKSVKRPKVIAAIAEAREHGDLKENAEYHAAREEQGFIEGRIKQLEGEPSHAEIIGVSAQCRLQVVFGASVTLADVETDEEKKYQIVGDLEADIKQGLIAIFAGGARDDRQAGRRFDRDRRPGRPARVRDRQRQLRGLTGGDGDLLPARSRFAAAALPDDVARALGRATTVQVAPGERAQLSRHFSVAAPHWPVAALTRQRDVGDAAGAAGCVPIRPAWCRTCMARG